MTVDRRLTNNNINYYLSMIFLENTSLKKFHFDILCFVINCVYNFGKLIKEVTLNKLPQINH